MNKIQEFLIKALGGYTAEQLSKKFDVEWNRGFREGVRNMQLDILGGECTFNGKKVVLRPMHYKRKAESILKRRRLSLKEAKELYPVVRRK